MRHRAGDLSRKVWLKPQCLHLVDLKVLLHRNESGTRTWRNRTTEAALKSRLEVDAARQTCCNIAQGVTTVHKYYAVDHWTCLSTKRGSWICNFTATQSQEILPVHTVA